MEIRVIDKSRSPIEIAISLEADDALMLARGAWARIGRVINADDAHVRAKAGQMFTKAEIANTLSGIARTNAAQQALDALGIPFVLAPICETPGSWTEGEPLDIRVKAFPVPDMELDLETPISRSAAVDGETDEELVRRALAGRLHGSMPEQLITAAENDRRARFRKELADAGITYREYRIENGLKPAQVEEDLANESLSQLREDIALDLVFIRKGLVVESQDEQAVLSEIDPERTEEVKREFLETGRKYLLQQKERRNAAVRWATATLLTQ